jgi:hypothetical protein
MMSSRYIRHSLVLSRLKEQSLKLKGKKCEFFKTEIKYFGLGVSDGGIKTDPDKVSNRSFNGLIILA